MGSLEQRGRPVGQSPVGIVGVPVPAGSLSLPSVEPRRVCSNLPETAAQPRPDLKGYGQLARHGQSCLKVLRHFLVMFGAKIQYPQIVTFLCRESK